MADKIRVLLTEEEVDKRINEVAECINKDYAGKSIHLICIFKREAYFSPVSWQKRLKSAGFYGFHVRIQLWLRYCIQRSSTYH